MNWLWKGGEGPKDIPDWVYPYLVLSLKADPDRLSRCKCMVQPDYIAERPVVLIRIFDPNPKKGVEIREFATLDRYPERILYEGYMDLETGKIVVSPSGGASSPFFHSSTLLR
jgi:hypothetical protein